MKTNDQAYCFWGFIRPHFWLRIVEDHDLCLRNRRWQQPFDFDAVLKCIAKLGYQPATRSESTGLRSVQFLGPKGYGEIEERDGETEIWIDSLEEAHLDAINECIGSCEVVEPPGVFMLKKQQDRVVFSRRSLSPCPLQVENYLPKVLVLYEDVRAGLLSGEGGRMVILNGDPGTGKSHFIRALMTEMDKIVFCLVAPQTVAALTGPELLSSLDEFRHGHAKKKPIVLLLEDADDCLVRRAADNMSMVSALLNMADGITGEALDMRILATTNARKLEMDPAILRPGRLLAQVEFERLPPKESNVVLDRLGCEVRVAKHSTIAELYELARVSRCTKGVPSEKSA